MGRRRLGAHRDSMADSPAVYRLDADSDDDADTGGEAEWELVARAGAPADPLGRWRRLARHIQRVWALRRLWGHLGGALRRYRSLR